MSAAVLLFAVGVANAQNTTFSPSIIGKPLTLEGRLEVLVEDYADGHSVERHFLETQDDRIELKFAGKPPHLSSGTRVRVRGMAQVDGLAVDDSAGNLVPLSTVMPNTMGEQSILVLLVNFQDDTSQPWTVAAANDLVFGTTSDHYRESSFGQTWFKGQTFGWFTIPMSKSVCDANSIASLANAKASEAGVPIGSFQRRVYMFPPNACGWQGLGDVGNPNSTAWVNGLMTLQVVGHELGHNYGLSHAHAMDCDTGVFGDTCLGYEYGDAADLMGNNRPGHFGAFEKEALGWLNDGISPPILTAATSGRYTIEPYSAGTAGPKALKIPRGYDSGGHQRWYYLEYRQPIGHDSVLADTGNLTKGVIARIAVDGDSGSSWQLDMSPDSTPGYFVDAADGALAVGQTHVEGVVGVSFTLVSASSSGADIDVVIGPPVCERATPKLSLTGGGAAVVGGTTVLYTLSITNRDNKICPATTFDLAGTVPANWTSSIAAKSLTINPGTTASTSFTVTSAPTAAIGDYAIAATTSSALGAAHAASASTTYKVTTCTRAAPTLSLTGGSSAVRAGTNVGYTLSITNQDGAACAPTTFALASSVPAGWTGTLAATSMTLQAGKSASTTLNVASDTSAALGSHGVGVGASSPVGALHTANASATYNISQTCTRAAPTITLAGGGTAVAPGATVAYTLNVTNRDSTACAGTVFNLARSVPTGWTSTLSKTSMALPPGATGSAAINVTSLASAAGGSYAIGGAASSPVGASHTASASASYLVMPKLSVADVSVIEGNAGGTATAKFTVSLTKPAVVPVTFNIATTNGTAIAGSDFTATSRTGVTIAKGSSSAVVSVPITGDVAIEANETFQAVVTNVVGATVADGTAMATIRNDDTNISIGDASIVEGNTGARYAAFTVALSNVSASPVTFSIATANATAASGSDYVARSLVGQTIPAGSTSMTFSVTIAGDTLVEANESFAVNLTGVAGATVADAKAVGTIRNDDTVLAIADASVAEGNAGTKTLSFTVKLSAASALPVTFNLATANKTATAGTDYVALALTAQSIPAGTTSKTFAVTIKGDTMREANETFVVNVASVQGAVVGDAQALGTVVNDD
ncbi:MAG: hypothetical protein HOQ01_06850 [Lysobacter sp.]|nr:hypothetical protein [Lysobacter sp.]